MTYELLFGKSPFGSDLIKLAHNKQMKPEMSTVNFPVGISIKEETKKFIENLLSQNPDDRMDMDSVLCHPFLKEEINRKAMTLQ